MGDEDILHQDDVEEVINEEIGESLVDASDEAAIADVVALTGGESPTEAEFNALAVKFNKVLGVLRDSNLIPT